MRFLNRLLGKMQKQNAKIVRVQTNGDSFTVHKNDGQSEKVSWSEIDKITAYKLDLLTYDTICLGLQRHDSEELMQICEETEDFGDFRAEMEKIFPDVDSQWYGNVMKPAFAENFTILFERQQTMG